VEGRQRGPGQKTERAPYSELVGRRLKRCRRFPARAGAFKAADVVATGARGHSAVSSTLEPGAGRWPFPRSPHGLGADALTFEGSRFRRTEWSRVTTSTTLMTFAALKEPSPARVAFPQGGGTAPGTRPGR
jgi:hypothetical protein